MLSANIRRMRHRLCFMCVVSKSDTQMSRHLLMTGYLGVFNDPILILLPFCLTFVNITMHTVSVMYSKLYEILSLFL